MTTKLDDRITIKINNIDQEFFMSFGLLSDLCSEIRDPGTMIYVPVDPTLRTMFLTKLLSERSTSGKLTKELGPDDVIISRDDALKLLKWATDHALDFLVQALLLSKGMVSAEMAESLQELIKSVKKTEGTLPDSSTGTPS